MERTKRLSLMRCNNARKKTRLGCTLSLERCMSCFESFEGTGRTEDDGRLPMAPCSGCGYQICLKCVRMQHAQDCMHRRSQSLAKYVSCPTPGCKQKRSFNAVEPILNGLACVLIMKRKKMWTGEERGLSEHHLSHMQGIRERMCDPIDSSFETIVAKMF